MKKTLLSYLLAAMIPSFAYAEEELKVFTYYDGDSNYTVDWCNTYGAGVKTDLAIEMPADITAGFTNATIEKLQIGTGVNAETGKFDNTDIVVWFSNDLNGEPFYSENAKLYESVMVFTDIQLSQPVSIEPGKPLYIGYTITGKSDKDFVIAGDALYDSTLEEKQWVRLNDGEWKHDINTVGNYAIRAFYRGESSTMPKNMATVTGGSLPYYIEPGKSAMGMIEFKNVGDNDIENLEVTYCIGDIPVLVKTVELPDPVKSKRPGFVYFDGITCDKIGNNISQSAYLSKVNGEPNAANELVNRVELNSYYSYLFCWPVDEGYKRNVVFEELTGTWCGNCPRGYVAMETMREEHPDGDFIGLAVHSNDQMDVVMGENPENPGIPVGPYAHIYYYAAGAPEILVNRASKVGGARLDNARISFEEFRNQIPAYATIDMELTGNDATVFPPMYSVKAKARFAGDETDADYRVSLVVSEDNVGPYLQTNYYADNARGECGGFENLPSEVELMYNDVVRYTDNFDGVEGSIPSTINKDVAYEYLQSIQLVNVNDPAQAYITAMIINGKTGVIENAVRKKVSDISAIEKNVAENAPVISVVNGCINVTGADSYSVHTVSGIDVTAMKQVSPGIYIVKAGNTVRKVVVR